MQGLSRRDFLKTTAAVGVGAAAAGWRQGSNPPPMPGWRDPCHVPAMLDTARGTVGPSSPLQLARIDKAAIAAIGFPTTPGRVLQRAAFILPSRGGGLCWRKPTS